ncbi:WAT1-related protein At3g30340-like [Lycium ferocissimum]|uniref:WAT1-related protein At3g30340-like n=1 Tax=Lycium ferocissimum TaxID=112874 RepID=UPI0028157357|nr:WAT1-related protein At3g30340-like [Lycium ferocissimum]
MSLFEKWMVPAAMIFVDFALAVANALLKKVLNRGMNQLVITTYRFSIAAIILTPIAFFLERNFISNLTGSIVCSLFFSALLGGTLTQYFFLIGLKYTSITFICAFINIVPVNTFIMALLLGQDSINMRCKSGRAKVLGTLCCLGGALILPLYKGMPLINQTALEVEGNHNTKSWIIGSSFLFAGSLVWSSWFIIQARIGKDYPYQYSSTAIMSFLGAIQSGILNLVIDRNTSTWFIKGTLEISSVIYAGIVGSGLCYVVMSWGVKQKGAVFTSAFSPFIQIFAAVIDISILHEQIHLGRCVLGSILVVIGLYILLWGKSKEAENLKNSPTAENGQATLQVTSNPSHT